MATVRQPFRSSRHLDMKLKTRRIEITASRHKIAIGRGAAISSDGHEAASLIELRNWNTAVKPDSEEGRRLIREVISMLEEIIESR
jgi:hypothetical protein